MNSLNLRPEARAWFENMKSGMEGAVDFFQKLETAIYRTSTLSVECDENIRKINEGHSFTDAELQALGDKYYSYYAGWNNLRTKMGPELHNHFQQMLESCCTIFSDFKYDNFEKKELENLLNNIKHVQRIINSRTVFLCSRMRDPLYYFNNFMMNISIKRNNSYYYYFASSIGNLFSFYYLENWVCKTALKDFPPNVLLIFEISPGMKEIEVVKVFSDMLSRVLFDSPKKVKFT